MFYIITLYTSTFNYTITFYLHETA